MSNEKGRLKFVGTAMKSGNGTSCITMFPEYSEALHGIGDYSHIIVLYWLHMNDSEEQRSILKVRPRRHKNAPEVGVFACRSPVRPNPIGLSVSRLLEVTEDTLTIEEIDVLDGTPIIDIKPYIPRADCVPDAHSPRC